MTGPVTTHFDGDALATALASGIHSLINQQDLLNRINVFPVADGDTGTNLSLSLGSALPILADGADHHLGTMLAAVADALLDGSRGNSGAIVAQFFQGMSDSAGEISRFTTYTFSKAVALGNEYARDALSEPRDGTILSVMAALANSSHQQVIKEKVDDFRVLLERAAQAVDEALAETPNQLDVLKKAGVVDAGAKGFATMLRGMTDFVVHGRQVSKPDLSRLFTDDMSFESSADGDESAYRFCTECIVTGTDIDRRKLRESVGSLGDSLVLAGTKRKAKIHVHVNDPDEVFVIAGKYGEVSAQKVDDMHRQHVSSHNASRQFAVITDSAADIPDDHLEALDIHLVPLRIQFGDRGYLDKVSISTDEFFHELEHNPQHPTTSQPSPGDFRRQFQFLASHFSDVISLNVTARVSGTLQAAEAAASRVDAPGKIHVIDTRSASLGQGMLAILAAECANAGMTAEQALKRLHEAIPQTSAFAVVKNLKYAVKGGRIPQYVKTIADILRLTPVIRSTQDGRIGTAGFLFGRSNRLKKFARYIARHVDDKEPLDILVGHAVCPDDAVELEKLLRARLPSIQRVSISELGTAFGVHGGPQTLVVAAQPARLSPAAAT
ncbi:MAG: DegV family EDD domain-containing protein [Woeseiaceae bacterium]|nr:DegV family EDD domain-containing protein [Woeseiaceae bacterium]